MKARKIVARACWPRSSWPAAAGWFSLDKETRGFLAALPTNRDVLFWSQSQRDAAFRALDRLPVLAKSRVVPAGATPMPLPPGPPLKLPLDVDDYMAGQRSAALLVVHDGKLRLERYGLGFDRSGRWTTFSVAKSITSTLVGAAIRDGHIKSMDDKVSAYIPEMKGSAYDDVSIRQLLTMTSGVRWNEDYADPNSDVAQFNKHKPEEGVDALVSYMRRLPREAPAGTRWHYSTGETNLVGVLLGRATKKPLGDLPLGKDLGAGRHGAAGDLDPQPQRQGDQRLLHPGRDARLRALRRLHPRTARASAGKASSPTAGSPRRRASASAPASPDSVVTDSVVTALRGRLASGRVRTEADARAVLREVLVAELHPELDRSVRALPHADHPAVMLVVGVNGTGKTTTVGKLARVLVADGRRWFSAPRTPSAPPPPTSCRPGHPAWGPRWSGAPRAPIPRRWRSTPSTRASRRAPTSSSSTPRGGCTPRPG